MSLVEAEVDYGENDWVKESLADDEDDNSLYHYKNKKIIVKTDIFFHLCPCSCKPKPVQIIKIKNKSRRKKRSFVNNING